MPPQRINDSIVIPKRRRFFHDGRVAKTVKYLPDYKESEITSDDPLAFTDCHKALETIIFEARLIGFEIARKRLPKKDRLLRRSITLTGDQRNLDMIFSSTIEEIQSALSVPSIEKLNCLSGERLKDVLGNLLKAHKDYKSSSAKLTYEKLPRLEKKFKLNIVEPLKEALINKSKPKFSKLIRKVTDYKHEILTACNIWRKNAEKVCKAIKGERGWKEAESLNKEIDDLLERAEATGWIEFKDKEFLNLDPHHAFNRAEGPEEVIEYLEHVLKKVEGTNEGKTLE